MQLSKSCSLCTAHNRSLQSSNHANAATDLDRCCCCQRKLSRTLLQTHPPSCSITNTPHYIYTRTMKALTFAAKETIVLADVEKPTVQLPTDVVVRVTLCGICGSDLHPYHEREKGLVPGTIVGHEFCGVVEECGSEVKALQPGDKVMSAFTTSCGSCFYCSKGITCRCSEPQGARCFGWMSQPTPAPAAGAGASEAAAAPVGIQGSQAQYVRVPLAEGTLIKVPEGVSDEESILLGDILSTAFFCVDQGGVSDGDTVVVLGCGPVGLLAVLAARQRGAAQVIAVDAVAARRDKAARFGALTADLPEAAAAVAAATNSRGADVALELVGSNAALQLGFTLLRPAGVLSSIGVHTAPQFPFSPVNAYDKNLTLRCGRCPARHYMQKLLPLVQSKAWPFTDIITHRMPLSQGVEAYHMFDKKLDGCIKVVLDPWA